MQCSIQDQPQADLIMFNPRAITAAAIVLLLHLPSKGSPLEKHSIPEILWSLDPLGFIAFVPSIICVLLALEVSIVHE